MTAGKLVQHKVEELELEGLPWSHYSIYWSTVHVHSCCKCRQQTSLMMTSLTSWHKMIWWARTVQQEQHW